MEKLIIPHTLKTPNIDFCPETGNLNLWGRLIPENQTIFIQPVFNWISVYAKNPAKRTVLNIYIEYFNTSASKRILMLFEEVQKIDNASIIWHHEHDEDDMEDCGKDYQSILELPFEIACFQTIDGIENLFPR